MLVQLVRLYNAYDGVGQIIVACDLVLENDVIVSGYAPLRKKVCFTSLNSDGCSSYYEQNTLLTSLLVGKKLNVVLIDQLLEDIKGSSEGTILSERICFAVSIAGCKANALIENMSYYDFFSCLTGMYDFSLPTPIVTIFTNNYSLSTLLVKNYSIIPSSQGMTLKKAHHAIMYIYFFLRDVMEKRNIPFFINDNGIYEVSLADFDIADLLLLAIEKVEKVYNIVFGMAVSFPIQEAYHHALKLYKLPNQMGTIDDLVEYYNLFINRYPIVMIEDGASLFSGYDWTVLEKKLPSSVLLIKDCVNNSMPEYICDSLGDQPVKAVMLGANGVTLITSLVQSIQYCRDKNILIGMHGAIVETLDDFLVDLSVGVHANYLNVGGIGRGEYTSKYNRLQYIETEIYDQCE